MGGSGTNGGKPGAYPWPTDSRQRGTMADLRTMPEVRVAGYAGVVKVWPGLQEQLDQQPQSLEDAVARMAQEPTGWRAVMPLGMYVPLQTLTVGIELGIMAPDPARAEALAQLEGMVTAATAAVGLSIGLRDGQVVAKTELNLIASLDPQTPGLSSWDPSVGAEATGLASYLAAWVDAGMLQASRHLELWQVLRSSLADTTDAEALLRERLAAADKAQDAVRRAGAAHRAARAGCDD